MTPQTNSTATQSISQKLIRDPGHVRPEASEGFVITPQVGELIERRQRLYRCRVSGQLFGTGGGRGRPRWRFMWPPKQAGP